METSIPSSHQYSRTLFCTITLAISHVGWGFHEAAHAVMPDPKPFILINNAGERPLGTAYVVPYYNNGRNVVHGVDQKTAVLVHQDGEEHPLPIVRERKNNASYGRFGMHNGTRTANAAADVQATARVNGVPIAPTFGEFLWDADTACDDHDLSLDVVHSYSPYQDRIDATKTRFKNLRRFEKIDEANALKGAPLKYKCTQLEDGVEEVYDIGEENGSYHPATTDREPTLLMYGTHVITQHHYGVYYKRSVKFSFQSEEVRQQFAAGIGGDAWEMGEAEVHTDFVAALSATEARFTQDCQQYNFGRLLHFLREQGQHALVDDFERRENAMMEAQSVAEVIATGRALYAGLSRLYRKVEDLDAQGVNLDHVLSVIAVTPELHGRGCQQQEGISLLDLDVASAHAWRAVVDDLNYMEKKKAKKADILPDKIIF